MNEWNTITTGLLNSTEDLKRLILENPDLPLVLFSHQIGSGRPRFRACNYITARKGEILDCMQDVVTDKVYDDRDDLRDDLMDKYGITFDGTDEEFTKFIEDKMLEYEPYWKPCIIIYAN